MPTRGLVSWATATRLSEIRDRARTLPPVYYQPCPMSVALARNQIVQRFLEGPWKVLAMVDDDVIPPPEFLSLADKLPGYAMLGWPYPLVQDQRELVLSVYTETPDGYVPIVPQEGLRECGAVGTGCVVIDRDALEAVGRNPFRIASDPNAAILGEDFLFCRDLARIGRKVGYWWDGRLTDHFRIVSLAPLLANAWEGRRA